MRIKKTGLCLALLFVFLFSVSGCGEREEKQESVELTFSWYGNEEVNRRMLEAVQCYEKQHPEVLIEAEYWEEEAYFQKIATDMANGSLPDIFQYEYVWYEQSIAGSLEAPADLQTLGIDFSGVEDCMEQNRTQDGKIILYPLAWTGSLFIVNQDFWDRHNLEVPKTLTWEEMIAVGSRVHEENSADYLLYASVDEMNRYLMPAYLFQSIKIQADGEFLLGSRQMADALETMCRIYESHTVIHSNEEAMVTGEIGHEEKWDNGQIGMRVGTVADFVRLKEAADFQVTAIPLPCLENAETGGRIYHAGKGLSINDHSEHPKEAAEFLQWLVSSEDAAGILGLTYGIPANRNIEDLLVREGVIDEDVRYAEAAAAAGASDEAVNRISKSLEELQKTALIRVLTKQMNVEEAAWYVVREQAR